MVQKKQMIIVVIGITMMTYGECLPVMISPWTSMIIEYLNESVMNQDSGLLFMTAFLFVGKYVIIYFFIYFGAFLFTFGFYRMKWRNRCAFLFIILSTLAMYFFNEIYAEYFAFQFHVLIVGLIVSIQVFIPEGKYSLWMSSIMMTLVLIAVQWLQLIPALSDFGLGHNDLATSIKLTDQYLTDNHLLNTLATVFFAIFIVLTMTVTALIYLQNKQIKSLEKIEFQEEELKETRIALVESTIYKEIATLVHDLKTPLVTIEGLLSLLDMKMQPKRSSKMSEYLVRMNRSVENMKAMISEILHENTKKPILPTELIQYVTSHFCYDEQHVELTVDIEDDLPALQLNKIRFSRAITNVLENAVNSFPGQKGKISIHVLKRGDDVLFQIRDNGPGIKNKDLASIWLDGFSTKESSGIGLSFVKRVVENHGGKIYLDSIPNRYTEVSIYIPVHISFEHCG